MSNSHPSENMPLSWPELPSSTQLRPGFVQLGVSLEPLAEVGTKESSRIGAKEDFAKAVGRCECA